MRWNGSWKETMRPMGEVTSDLVMMISHLHCSRPLIPKHNRCTEESLHQAKGKQSRDGDTAVLHGRDNSTSKANWGTNVTRGLKCTLHRKYHETFNDHKSLHLLHRPAQCFLRPYQGRAISTISERRAVLWIAIGTSGASTASLGVSRHALITASSLQLTPRCCVRNTSGMAYTQPLSRAIKASCLTLNITLISCQDFTRAHMTANDMLKPCKEKEIKVSNAKPINFYASLSYARAYCSDTHLESHHGCKLGTLLRASFWHPLFSSGVKSDPVEVYWTWVLLPPWLLNCRVMLDKPTCLSDTIPLLPTALFDSGIGTPFEYADMQSVPAALGPWGLP